MRTSSIPAQMAHSGVHGLSVAVIDHGQLVRAEGYGRLEANTDRKTEPHHLFHTCSISKTITAIAALTLVQDGLLNLDIPVSEYLCTGPLPFKGVTLRHLLSHQAGIIDPESSFEPLRPGEARPTLAQILRGETRFLSQPLCATEPPGTRFVYSDGGYGLIEHLLTEVTGGGFANLVSKRVLRPLGLERTRIDPPDGPDLACGHDQHGVVITGRRPVYPLQGAAGVWSSASDLAQVALEVLAALQGQGRFLTRQMAEAMTSPPWNPFVGLGLFLDARVTDRPWYYHYGWGEGFQGALSFSPSLKSGVVILINAEPGRPQWESLVGQMGRLIAAEMGWPRSPIPDLS